MPLPSLVRASAAAASSSLSSASYVRPAFVAHAAAYLQTSRPLEPTHLHESFIFRGSIPSGETTTRDDYLAYRDGVLSAFPDWVNRATELVFSRGADGKESVVAKVSWTGTNTGDGGVLGETHKATGRRVSYRGIVWLEQDSARCDKDGVDGLTAAEVYGDLASFKRQLAGEETVGDDEWAEARALVDLGV